MVAVGSSGQLPTGSLRPWEDTCPNSSWKHWHHHNDSLSLVAVSVPFTFWFKFMIIRAKQLKTLNETVKSDKQSRTHIKQWLRWFASKPDLEMISVMQSLNARHKWHTVIGMTQDVLEHELYDSDSDTNLFWKSNENVVLDSRQPHTIGLVYSFVSNVLPYLKMLETIR